MRGRRLSWLALGAMALLVGGVALLVVRVSSQWAGRPPPGGVFAYQPPPAPGAARPEAGYRLARRLATGLPDVRAVAVQGTNRIYVADAHTIRALDALGATTAEWSVGGDVRCLAVNAGGQVLAGVDDTVLVFEPDGGAAARWPAPASNALITGIAAGRVSVTLADAGQRQVYRCDGEGRVVAVLAGEGADSFVVPSPYFDVGLGPDGRLLIANPGRHRVEVWGVDNRRQSAWGQPGLDVTAFCGCCNPAHFAVLPDGGVVTSEKGLRRVKLHDGAGRLRQVLLDTDTLGEGPVPCDVAVDATGCIWVAVAGTGELIGFER